MSRTKCHTNCFKVHSATSWLFFSRLLLFALHDSDIRSLSDCYFLYQTNKAKTYSFNFIVHQMSWQQNKWRLWVSNFRYKRKWGAESYSNLIFFIVTFFWPFHIGFTFPNSFWPYICICNVCHRNSVITGELLSQGCRFHILFKTFTIFYYRYKDIK